METGVTYSYKVVRVDGAMLALRRAVIYFCILLFIISTALVILFILFERYLMLLLCFGLYAVDVLLLILSGRGEHYYSYHVTGGVLEIISESGAKRTFSLTDRDVLAPYDGDEDASVIKYCFPLCRVTARSVTQDNVFKKYILTVEAEKVMLLLDTYAVVLLQRSER